MLSLDFIYLFLFELNKVYQYIDATKQEVNYAFKLLLRYCNGASIDLTSITFGNQEQFFNSREITHMLDVQQLVGYLNSVLMILFLLFVVMSVTFFLKKESVIDMYQNYIQSIKISLVLLCGLASYILINFNQFWLQFHEIFFSNDLYLLDPNDSRMINMLPGELFQQVVLLVLLFTFLLQLCLFIGYRKRMKRIRND